MSTVGLPETKAIQENHKLCDGRKRSNRYTKKMPVPDIWMVLAKIRFILLDEDYSNLSQGCSSPVFSRYPYVIENKHYSSD